MNATDTTAGRLRRPTIDAALLILLVVMLIGIRRYDCQLSDQVAQGDSTTLKGGLASLSPSATVNVPAGTNSLPAMLPQDLSRTAKTVATDASLQGESPDRQPDQPSVRDDSSDEEVIELTDEQMEIVKRLRRENERKKQEEAEQAKREEEERQRQAELERKRQEREEREHEADTALRGAIALQQEGNLQDAQQRFQNILANYGDTAAVEEALRCKLEVEESLRKRESNALLLDAKGAREAGRLAEAHQRLDTLIAKYRGTSAAEEALDLLKDVIQAEQQLAKQAAAEILSEAVAAQKANNLPQARGLLQGMVGNIKYADTPSGKKARSLLSEVLAGIDEQEAAAALKEAILASDAGNLDEAGQQFRNILSTYPRTAAAKQARPRWEKVQAAINEQKSSAALECAIAAIDAGALGDAKGQLQNVIKTFAETRAASAARQRLEQVIQKENEQTERFAAKALQDAEAIAAGGGLDDASQQLKTIAMRYPDSPSGKKARSRWEEVESELKNRNCLTALAGADQLEQAGELDEALLEYQRISRDYSGTKGASQATAKARDVSSRLQERKRQIAAKEQEQRREKELIEQQRAESEAKENLNAAVAVQHAGKLTETRGLLQGIAKQYPNTLAGREAKTRLATIQAALDEQDAANALARADQLEQAGRLDEALLEYQRISRDYAGTKLASEAKSKAQDVSSRLQARIRQIAAEQEKQRREKERVDQQRAESEAKKKLDTAVAAQQAGKLPETLDLLQGIVGQYPNTPAGEEAKRRLAAIQALKVQQFGGGTQTPRVARSAQPTQPQGKTREKTDAEIDSVAKTKAKDREGPLEQPAPKLQRLGQGGQALPPRQAEQSPPSSENKLAEINRAFDEQREKEAAERAIRMAERQKQGEQEREPKVPTKPQETAKSGNAGLATEKQPPKPDPEFEANRELQSASSLYATGRVSDAQKVYQNIATKFPGTEAARTAQKWLSDIKAATDAVDRNATVKGKSATETQGAAKTSSGQKANTSNTAPSSEKPISGAIKGTSK